jgi:hypothetical protein
LKRTAVLAFAALASCTSGSASPASDAGSTPPVDAGGCGEACAPPDGGGCASAGERCSREAPCCPGNGCGDAGVCQALVNPCPNGEQIVSNGCGCDPALGILCNPGFVCGPDLHCDADAGYVPLPSRQPAGAPCDPAAPALDAGPACETPDGSLPVACIADPTGLNLYVCAQSCASDADCPLAWQSCGSSFAEPGYCGDSPCTTFPTAASDPAFFTTCKLPGDGVGLCLPFATSLEEDGTAVTLSYGLCVQAVADAGVDGPCEAPPRRGGELCDPRQVCVLGLCRSSCNASAEVNGCNPPDVCAPVGIQAAVAGAPVSAGGCVPACELANDCDAGVRDAGAPPDAGGPDAGRADGGATDGGDGGVPLGDGGDGG